MIQRRQFAFEIVNKQRKIAIGRRMEMGQELYGARSIYKGCLQSFIKIGLNAGESS